MWKVVYIAQNKESMKRAKLLLEKNGFLVQVKEVNSNGTLQKWSNNCKLEFKNGILVSGSAWSDS